MSELDPSGAYYLTTDDILELPVSGVQVIEEPRNGLDKLEEAWATTKRVAHVLGSFAIHPAKTVQNFLDGADAAIGRVDY